MRTTTLTALAALTAAWALPTAALAAVDIEDIRIGQHSSFLRIVLDVSGPVTYRVSDGAIIIDGVETGSAVLNADASQAPLKRLTVTPEGTTARLSFDATTAVSLKAFALTPDSFGGNRLVVDLIPDKQGRVSSAAPEPVASLVPAPAGTDHGQDQHVAASATNARAPAVGPAQGSNSEVQGAAAAHGTPKPFGETGATNVEAPRAVEAHDAPPGEHDDHDMKAGDHGDGHAKNHGDGHGDNHGDDQSEHHGDTGHEDAPATDGSHGEAPKPKTDGHDAAAKPKADGEDTHGENGHGGH